jgi:hypothetical protein
VIDADTSDDGPVDVRVDGEIVSIRAGERSRREILAAARADPDLALLQRIGERTVPVRFRVMLTGGEVFLTQTERPGAG